MTIVVYMLIGEAVGVVSVLLGNWLGGAMDRRDMRRLKVQPWYPAMSTRMPTYTQSPPSRHAWRDVG